MDIIMDIVFEVLAFIFDIITDILFEGTVKHMKIPTILRVLFTFLIFLVYLGFSGFLLYIGYNAYMDKEFLMAFLFVGLGILVLLGGLYETKKAEKRKSVKNDKEIIE